MVYDNLRRVQRFKIVFCRSVLLSNIQICYPRKIKGKKEPKTIVFKTKNNRFCLTFFPRVTSFKILETSHIVVKPFKSLN